MNTIRCLTLILLTCACSAEQAPATKLAGAAQADAAAQAAPFDPAELEQQLAELAQAVTALQDQVTAQDHVAQDLAALQDLVAALPEPATPAAPADLSGLATKADVAALQAKLAKLAAVVADLPMPTAAPDLTTYAKSAELAALQQQLQALSGAVAALPKTGGPVDLAGYVQKAELAQMPKASVQVLNFPNKSTVAMFTTTGSSQMFLASSAQSGNAGPAIDGQAYPPADMVLFPVLTTLAPGQHTYDRIDKCAGSCPVLVLDLP